MQKIIKHIKQSAYFDSHQKVLVAVSGGLDSMALLSLLDQAKDDLKIQIAIAHVNHQQRPESEQEEAYLRALAEEKSLPIFVSHFSGTFSEKAARDFRYAFFRKIMKEESYTALVTAHHADDQAETVLMRVIRGGRLRQLSAIKAVQTLPSGQLIRPLLPFKKSDLPQVFHFEDSSNQGQEYFRNRVRNSYLPQLEQENPRLTDALISLAEETNQLYQALENLTKDLDEQNVILFQSQPPAVQTFLLQSYLEKIPCLELSKAQFKELLHILNKKEPYEGYIKSNYYLHKNHSRFEITKEPSKVQVFSPYKLEFGQRGAFMDRIFQYGEFDDGLPIYDCSPIILRQRRPGDAIDFGNFHKKIKRLLIDDKIPVSERSSVIIGEQAGKIIFVLTNHRTYLSKAAESGIMKAKLYIKKKDSR